LAGMVAAVPAIGISLVVGLTGTLLLDDFLLILLGSLTLGFIVAACINLVQLSGEVRSLTLPAAIALPSEAVVMEVMGVHYRTGRPWRFWEAVGGKIIVTNLRLVFIAHRGQPWRYTLLIPLEEVATAEPCRILRAFTGGLRVVTVGGKTE